jgi:hypothetical protein
MPRHVPLKGPSTLGKGNREDVGEERKQKRETKSNCQHWFITFPLEYNQGIFGYEDTIHS